MQNYRFRTRALCVTVLLMAGSVAMPVLAGPLRCGNALVSEGDSTADLLLKCGKPLLVEPLTLSALSKQGQLTQIQTGELWTMDMGKGKFMQRVTVSNGIIQKIEDGPRH